MCGDCTVYNPIIRYGGWYTDTDTVTVDRTDHLENVVASSGAFVANGNLVFSPGNGFLEQMMIRAEQKFTGKGWNSLGSLTFLFSRITHLIAGPVLLTETIMSECHAGRGTNQTIIGDHPDCWGLSVLNHTIFYPLKSPERRTLFQQHGDNFWKQIFFGAVSVHFFGSNTSGRGWVTGNHTAYDYLGRLFCPSVYSVQNNMNLWYASPACCLAKAKAKGYSCVCV